MRCLLSLRALVFLFVATLSAQGWAGTYKFCGQWSYYFTDAGYGEDFLKNTAGQNREVAAYAQYIVRRNGLLVTNGYLDSTGCTPTVSGDAGNYEFTIMANLFRQGPYRVQVYPTAAEQTRYFTWTGTRPGTTGNSTSTMFFGSGDRVARVAAVLTRAFRSIDGGLVTGVTYKAYTDEGCGFTTGGLPISACAGPTVMKLGYDPATGWDADWKYIIAHEFGHLVNHNLFVLRGQCGRSSL